MAGKGHLVDQSEFAESFKAFCANLEGIFRDEQNYVRLFDIWLSNIKDEKVIAHQLKKEPWEDGDGSNPWD